MIFLAVLEKVLYKNLVRRESLREKKDECEFTKFKCLFGRFCLFLCLIYIPLIVTKELIEILN